MYSLPIIFLKQNHGKQFLYPHNGSLGRLFKSDPLPPQRGRRTTTIEKLYALADYFGVSVDYLIGRTDNPKVNK